MISREEVKHLAKLAHLYLGEKEVKKYQKELSEILDYVSQLQKVKGRLGVAQENFGQARSDEEWRESISAREKILAAIPAREKDFIKTKSVFAKSKKTIKKSRKI